MGTSSERSRELRRRSSRKRKMSKLRLKAAKATLSEKAHLAQKIRRLTPGAEIVIANLKLEER